MISLPTVAQSDLSLCSDTSAVPVIIMSQNKEDPKDCSLNDGVGTDGIGDDSGPMPLHIEIPAGAQVDKNVLAQLTAGGVVIHHMEEPVGDLGPDVDGGAGPGVYPGEGRTAPRSRHRSPGQVSPTTSKRKWKANMKRHASEKMVRVLGRGPRKAQKTRSPSPPAAQSDNPETAEAIQAIKDMLFSEPEDEFLPVSEVDSADLALLDSSDEEPGSMSAEAGGTEQGVQQGGPLLPRGGDHSQDRKHLCSGGLI